MTTTRNDSEIWVLCDTLFTPFQRRHNWLLHISQGKIRRILPAHAVADLPEERLIHLPDAMVAPGFLDLHVHGGLGHDLMEGTAEALQTVSSLLARHGTTSFLATTMSAHSHRLEAVLRGLAANPPSLFTGARPVGIHLEGPYLNPLRGGVHDHGCLRNATVQEFLRFVDSSEDTIRKITIAPEMDPGLEVIRTAAEYGIQVSLGHSEASEALTRAAIDAGATHATHTFNAMRPLHQRESGILGAVLTDERVYAEVIADGIHVHPTNLQLLLRVKNVEHTPLVTDGSSAVGMPEGRYTLGDSEIVLEQGTCRDHEGRLAGSILTLDRAVRNLVEWLDIPLHDALAAASATPARSMRWGDSKGIISPGADADLVFLSRDLEVVQTMVAGRIVYCGADEVPTTD